MKKKNLFLAMALMATTLFSACSNDDDAIHSDIPGVEKSEPTYATFNFKVENGTSKTRDATDMTGDALETAAVKDIRLLVFKTGASTVCEVNTLYDDAEANWTSSKSATVLLTAGNKRIFVITNTKSQPKVNAALTSILVNATTLAQFYAMTVDLSAGIVGDFNINEITHSDGMVMSNVADLSSLKTLQPGISATDSRGGTAAQNNFTFPVYRVAAKGKLMIKDNATLTVADGTGTLQKVMYGFRNVNKSIHLFQRFSGDDFHFNPTTSIPRAPYFNQFDGLDASALGNHSTYANYYYSEYTSASVPVGAPDPVAMYLTENTNSTPRIGNSTYAAIEAEFLPKKEFVVTGFTYDALNKTFTTITHPAADIAAATDLYVVRTSAGVGQNLTANIFISEDLAYEAAYYLEVGDDRYTNTADVMGMAGVTARVNKYTEGKCYYRLNLGEQVGADMVYGVKRNNSYLASITKFAGLGVSTADELTNNPETPLGSKTHVTASITIESWREITTDNEI